MIDFGSPATMLLFSLFWYAFLAAFVYCLDHFTACFRRWSVFSVLVPLILLEHGISVPFVIEAASDQQGVSSDLYALPWIASLVGMYVFLFLGAATIGRAYPKSARLESSLVSGFCGTNMLPILILFWLSVVGVLVQVALAPRFVSLGELFSAEVSAEDYSEQRLEFSDATAGAASVGNYLISVALNSIIPITLFASYQARKSSLMYRFTLLAALSLLLLRGFWSGHKASVVLPIVALVAIHLFLKYRGKVRVDKTQVYAALATVFVLIPTLYYLQYSNYISSYSEALQAGVYRLLEEPNRALQLYIYVYPDTFDFLHGASSRLAAALMGADKEFSPPHTDLPLLWGITGVTWNVVFIGDAWADFGAVGVLVSSFAVGAMLKSIDQWFWHRRQRGWLEVAVFFAEIFAVMRLSAVGLPTALIGFGIVPSLLLWGLAVATRVPAAQRKRAGP